MTLNAGTVGVKVVPDTSGFKDALKIALADALSELAEEIRNSHA